MRLEIKVFPKSSRQEVVERDGSAKVYITEAPEKGKANKAVIELVAKYYKVKKSQVSVVLGLKSRNKVIEIVTSDK